jgi:hypothetical protein
MSIDLMREIKEEGASSIAELRVILNRSESAVYDYFNRTELSAGQFFRLFALAKSDRVREIILKHLLPGSGCQVVWLPDALDADGDGDVDTDDATSRAINAVGVLHKTLKALRDESGDRSDAASLQAMRESFIGLVEEATAGLAIIDWLIKQAIAHPRRRARPVLNGETRKGARGV